MARALYTLLLGFLTAQAVLAQICETRNTYLPVADKYGVDVYGSSIGVFEDFMVVGAADNDSLQAVNGLAYVYRLNASQEWERIAKLAPSDPQRSLQFGGRVGIDGTTIAISARRFDDAGAETSTLYIFERPPGGQWTTGTETYKMQGNQSFGNFEILNDELVTAGSNGLTIYNKTAGVFTKTQSIAAPLDKRGTTGFFGQITLGDDLIAVGVEQFVNSDGHSGIVFLYEKTAGVYPTVPVRLRSSINDYTGFGRFLKIHNETVFVSSAFVPTSPNFTVQGINIFEKPLTGWADATETVLLKGTTNLYSDQSMLVDDNYVMVTGLISPYNILGFKKTGADWSSGVVEFLAENPNAGPAYGYELELTQDHLIVGGPAYTLKTPVPEKIFDFHRPAHDWENINDPDQVLTETSINAANVRFGFSIATSEDFLFVGAENDDEHANDGGAVYIFDKTKPPGAPPVKIFEPIVENSSSFGHAIAAAPDLLFVSALTSDSLTAGGTIELPSIGRVFVYKMINGTWTYQSQILAPQVTYSGGFGQTIKYSNGYLAISEYEVGRGRPLGKVHIYKQGTGHNFVFLATLLPSGGNRDTFGRSIILTDSIVVVGTGLVENNAFIYRKKGEWKNAFEDAILSPKAKVIGDQFGASMSMDGEYIVVGAPGYRVLPSGVGQLGTVFVFKMPKGGWKGTVTDIAQLLPSNKSDLSYFGYSVIISNDDIFVGAPHSIGFQDRVDFITNNDNVIKPGTIYHYVREGNEWLSTEQEERQIQAGQPEYLDGFGARMILDDRILYISSLFDNTTAGFRSGSVQSLGLPPFIIRVPDLCVSSSPVNLRAGPVGGKWSGAGVSAPGVFDPKVSAAGSHLVKYEVGGCTAERPINVLDGSIVVNNVSPETSTKCVSGSISLTFDTDVPATSSFWSYKSKETETYKKLDSLKETIVAKSPGYYSVEVRNAVCPNVTRSFVVNNEQAPEIKIDPLDIVCNDKVVQLSALPAGGVWSGGSVTSSGKIETVGMNDGKYDYKYTYTSPLTCEYSKVAQVQVDKLKIPAVSKDKERICGDDAVTLTATNVDERSRVVWKDENGNTLGDKKLLKVVEAGNYLVTAIKYSCTTESGLVHVDALVDSLFVPNVFTPNGDSYNDYFQIDGSDLNDFNVLIYNRYGDLVYENNDPSFKWEATGFSTGTYFWKVVYETCNGEVKEEKGWVQLVR